MHDAIFTRYPHNPPHLFLPDTYYMLTASTYQQTALLDAPARKLDWAEVLSENDYYNRLRYVFWNLVKHGLVNDPAEYPFSNYKEFLANWQVEFNFTATHEVNNVPEF